MLPLSMLICHKMFPQVFWQITMQLNHQSSCAHSPELHDTGDIAWRIDASDVIEVANKQAPIDAPCESNRSQQFVSLRLPITARTGDASASAVPHYGADDGRKLGEEDVLTISLIQDPWDTRECGRKKWGFFFFLKNNDFLKNQSHIPKKRKLLLLLLLIIIIIIIIIQLIKIRLKWQMLLQLQLKKTKKALCMNLTNLFYTDKHRNAILIWLHSLKCSCNL